MLHSNEIRITPYNGWSVDQGAKLRLAETNERQNPFDMIYDTTLNTPHCGRLNASHSYPKYAGELEYAMTLDFKQ